MNRYIFRHVKDAANIYTIEADSITFTADEYILKVNLENRKSTGYTMMQIPKKEWMLQ